MVLPLTGGAAFVGQGQKDTLTALEEQVNATGGIGGEKLHFVFHDDQTRPQVAVQLTSGILGSKPAVVMGSSLVAMCLAMAPLMTNGTLHYCLSPAIHPKPGSYTFSASSSSIDQIAAVARYYRMKGWTKIATLMTTDASGQDGERAVDEVLNYPENKGVMTKVVEEHFNPTDISVSAQVARIKASGAQAMIAWTTGAPAATVFRGMAQAALDMPVAPTSGNQTFAAMDQWEELSAQAVHPRLRALSAACRRAEARSAYRGSPARHVCGPEGAPSQGGQHGRDVPGMPASSWSRGCASSVRRRRRASATSLPTSPTSRASTGSTISSTSRARARPTPRPCTTYDAKTDLWVWLSKPGGAPLN